MRRFFQASTDEVYGPIESGAWDEESRTRPSNPYSASKAAADAFVQGYAVTHGLETVIGRMENVYGPYQHRQKAIPTFIRCALADEPLPVYGDGRHRRQWLWVDDACAAIWILLNQGQPGGVYHIAGSAELENLELARMILKALGRSPERIRLVPDHDLRPGHDRRYAIAVGKLRAYGWKAHVPLAEGLDRLCTWHAKNWWWLA